MEERTPFSLRKERSDAQMRLRAAVVEAAAKILAAGGVNALTARELAQAIGASTKVIYSHFGGMPGVIAAVYADAFSLLAKDMEAADRANFARNERLHAVAVAYRKFASREPRLFALMYGPRIAELAPTKTDRAAAAASLSVIIRIFEDDGILSETARKKTYAFWATIHGAVALESTGWAAERANDMFRSTLAAAILQSSDS